MKEICKRYLTTAPLYGIIPMMRDLRNKEMYIALDDYKEMYAESCMKRGESLSVNGLKEFIAARQARLALMRGSLSKIGLTFGQYPAMTESSGEFSLPLTLFGGRFGKDVDTPHDEFLEDDGISNNIEGGLSLNVSYEMTETNQCKLRANIS
tara:strand:+ start:117 stop:572 length:456 start_codon:yes stop_codon:yes gene_type:complete